MRFLFERIFIAVEFPNTRFRVCEVDTNIYLATPLSGRMGRYNYKPEEFSLSKTKNKWKSNIPYNENIVQEIGKAIDDFLFNERFKKTN